MNFLFFKKIIYRFYHIAIQEDWRRKEVRLRKVATLSKETILLKSAEIYDHRNDKTKIIVGKHTQLNGELMIFGHGGEIIIGDYGFIGQNTRIWSAKKITIGNRVLISHNVNIHDQISHPMSSIERHLDFKFIIETGRLRSENNIMEKEVIIEDDVWIGFGSSVMKGVRIGKGAVVGAYSMVTKDIPPFAVVVGNPARVIKYTN